MWLSAEYSESLIAKWFTDREWEPLDSSTLAYYRKQWADDIAAVRQQRRDDAINSGLALKAERIRRLAEHADELEAIKWLPDKNGRMWNEKAWRETLDDIAKEMGDRRQGVDASIEGNVNATQTIEIVEFVRPSHANTNPDTSEET